MRNSGKKRSAAELFTAVHIAVLLVASAWYFGGASNSARIAISAWGSVGAIHFVYQLVRARALKGSDRVSFGWLVPIVLFNLVTLASLHATNLIPLLSEGESLYIKRDGLASWIPSTAGRPETLLGLWLFDAIYLSCCQLVVTVKRRGTIRLLLAVGAANAAALAIFGTLQKLVGATGLFFGAVESPQKYFFASFVYDNHWGAFCVLSTGIAVALTLRTYRRMEGRDLLHSPFVSEIIGITLVAIAVPLSGSRACSLLVLILLGIATFEWLRSATQSSSRTNYQPSRAPYLVAGAIVILALAAVWFVAGDMISERAEKTKDQVGDMMHERSIGGRALLYQDTWRMAKDRLLFGWGANSYPRVFMFYNTTEAKLDKIPVYFHDAHSDWLQSVAEHGVVGTLLLALCAVGPFLLTRGRSGFTVVPRYLLMSAGLVLLYAIVEFPFGNPAVTVSWWFALFAGARYATLESKNT